MGAEHPSEACAVKRTFRGQKKKEIPLQCSYSTPAGSPKVKPFQLAALVKTGQSDDNLVRYFGIFVKHESERRRKDWHGRWSVAARDSEMINGDISPDRTHPIGSTEICRCQELQSRRKFQFEGRPGKMLGLTHICNTRVVGNALSVSNAALFEWHDCHPSSWIEQLESRGKNSE